MTYVCGIDEAGRGPVIGPMVMALVAIEEGMEFELKTLGVDDSKKLSPIKRKELAEVIRREGLVEIITASAQEIDDALRDPAKNLNILEAEMAGKLINAMNKRLGKKIKHIILDCPSNNKAAYLTLMKKYIDNGVKLIAEHKADALYPVVSMASIIAKVERDRQIDELKKKHGVDFGSGYPGDEVTARFVREHHADYPFFRTTWETYRRVLAGREQRTLNHEDNPILESKKKKLLALGLTLAETKGAGEALRAVGQGVSVTIYHNGRVLVQGKNKEEWMKKVVF